MLVLPGIVFGLSRRLLNLRAQTLGARKLSSPYGIS